ncbi:MAG TPA: hypothetical protein VN281_20145 [Verrucomicrobiae bacterium]|nr:hypothetical protein [Verrucomicrobiae bacterium]
MQKRSGSLALNTSERAHLGNGASPFRRLARACLWHDPAVYRWFGWVRRRGDCFNLDFDLWIDGFPGSANALAAKAFQQANPTARLRGRWHTPPFILHALFNFKPGILLVRQPADAAVSHAILSNRDLADCLDYYNDFHRILSPHASWLFVVTFEEIMTQFATVIDGFNLHYRTAYLAPAQNPAAFLAASTPGATAPEASSHELRVVRPAASHSSLKQELRQRLHENPVLRRKLEHARQLYSAFVPGGRRTPIPKLSLSTRHLPSLA